MYYLPRFKLQRLNIVTTTSSSLFCCFRIHKAALCRLHWSPVSAPHQQCQLTHSDQQINRLHSVKDWGRSTSITTFSNWKSLCKNCGLEENNKLWVYNIGYVMNSSLHWPCKKIVKKKSSQIWSVVLYSLNQRQSLHMHFKWCIQSHLVVDWILLCQCKQPYHCTLPTACHQNFSMRISNVLTGARALH